MSSDSKSNPWILELNEILDKCRERARIPAALPHCAICARYATDNLPFEALMSLFDVMPRRHRAEALRIAERRLTKVPASLRQQQAGVTTLPVLMDSPGRLLVRSLVIAAPLEELPAFLGDPRLALVEEITLLGYAYEDYVVPPSFLDALLNSPALTRVRALIFHSVSLDADGRRKFLGSAFATRLKRIEGMRYAGEEVARLSALQELTLYGPPCTAESAVLPLFDPRVTPSLRRLSLGAWGEGATTLLRSISANAGNLDRLDSVDVNLSAADDEVKALLRSCRLPRSLTKFSVLPKGLDNWNASISVDCHNHLVVSRKKDAVHLRLGDRISAYGDAIIDWTLMNNISKGLQELNLFLPANLPVADLLHGLRPFAELKRLMLVCPFTKPALDKLLRSPKVQGLEKLSLVLTLKGNVTTQLMSAKEAEYRDTLPAEFLFRLALGGPSSGISELTVVSESLNLRRARGRIEQLDIKQADALRALIRCQSHLPVESLCLMPPLRAPDAERLAESSLLSRVYRFRIDMEAEAARILARCPRLRTVRAISPRGFDKSPAAFETFVNSPHLGGVWELNLWADVEGADRILADSPLLDRVVVLALDGVELNPHFKATRVSRSGRLRRLRRLDEGLNMRLFGDARIATAWLESGATPPLMAKLRKFVDGMYRVQRARRDIAELEKKLRAPDLTEAELVDTVRSLLAVAFGGKPVSHGRPFRSLNQTQKRVVRSISHVDSQDWLNADLGKYLFSYGLAGFESYQLKNYIEGRDIFSYPGTGT